MPQSLLSYIFGDAPAHGPSGNPDTILSTGQLDTSLDLLLVPHVSRMSGQPSDIVNSTSAATKCILNKQQQKHVLGEYSVHKMSKHFWGFKQPKRKVDKLVTNKTKQNIIKKAVFLEILESRESESSLWLSPVLNISKLHLTD